MSSIAKIIRELFKSSNQFDADINTAMGELLELEKERPILVVVVGVGAWSVPYTEGTLKALVTMAETKNRTLFAGFAHNCRGSLPLMPEHHFEAKHYSEVVVA